MSDNTPNLSAEEQIRYCGSGSNGAALIGHERSLVYARMEFAFTGPTYVKTEIYERSRRAPSFKMMTMAAEGGLEYFSMCSQCDALHASIAERRAAEAKKEKSDEEEAELRKELLRLQIAALRKKQEE